MNGLLAVADLRGDPRRRAHDRRMRRLLGGSALVTIIVSALILFVWPEEHLISCVLLAGTSAFCAT